MKTILTLVLVFGIQLSGLMAANSNEVVTPTEPSELFCPECIVLSPTVPMEATFAEQTEFDFSMNLIPDIPMEAEFDEVLTFPIVEDNSFAPVVPSTASFSDAL